MKTTLLLILLFVLMLTVSFEQDDEREEEIEDLSWEVSDIKFSFQKTQSFKEEELDGII